MNPAAFAMILLLIGLPAWCADDCVWHETEGSAFADQVSSQEARRLAVARAAFAAVEQQAGVSISGATVVKDSTLLTDIVISLAEGFIAKKEELGWSEGFHKLSPTEPAIPSYTVRLRSCVSSQAASDPYFTLNLSTDKVVYSSGDDVNLTARPSRDAYISFFHVSEDENVTMLFFGDYPTKLCVKEAEKCYFPPTGFGLRARTSPGKTKAIETFIAIATKEWFDFAGAFKGQKKFDLSAFFTVTAKIPAKSRALAIAPFEVRSQ